MDHDRWVQDMRGRLDELLDQHRQALRASLVGMSDIEARERLVPSKTTLLGLVKHGTYLEKFYFDHLVTGRTLKELGVAETPGGSFTLRKDDTISEVQEAHRQACAASRSLAAGLPLGATVNGARGQRTVWAIYTQMLRELAQHCGHADILREQLIARRQA